MGGARPKALLADGPRSVIAKFSSSSDPYPVVKAEYIAMELAQRAGIDAARRTAQALDYGRAARGANSTGPANAQA